MPFLSYLRYCSDWWRPCLRVPYTGWLCIEHPAGMPWCVTDIHNINWFLPTAVGQWCWQENLPSIFSLLDTWTTLMISSFVPKKSIFICPRQQFHYTKSWVVFRPSCWFSLSSHKVALRNKWWSRALPYGTASWIVGFHHRFWTLWDGHFLKLQSILFSLRHHLLSFSCTNGTEVPPLEWA